MFFSENLVLDEEHFLVCTAQSTTGFDIFAEYFPKYVKKKKTGYKAANSRVILFIVRSLSSSHDI